MWVIANSDGRERNEQVSAREGLSDNLHFVYYDHERFPQWFGHTRLGYYTYLQSWQFGAYLLAKRLHKRIHFDAVHHVTFAMLRVASFMGKLGIPFTLGPVAGGERMPWKLRRSLPASGKVRELVRDLHNVSIRFSPIVRSSIREARRILVTNVETLELIPPRYRSKCRVQLAIGLDADDCSPEKTSARPGPGFKAIYAGRLEARKGIHLALRAFAQFHEEFPESEFTIVGTGPQEAWLRSLAAALGLDQCLQWIPWLTRSELMRMYEGYDVLLFPSLRDSGGFVILEAFAKGLPVICLDLGGPGIMVDASCGRSVATSGASERDVIAAIAAELTALAREPNLRDRLGHGALLRVQQFRWSNVIN